MIILQNRHYHPQLRGAFHIDRIKEDSRNMQLFMSTTIKNLDGIIGYIN